MRRDDAYLLDILIAARKALKLNKASCTRTLRYTSWKSSAKLPV
jgi:hypothetical protein